MPQLDPTWFSSQLFWLTVTFVLLYVVMARSVVPVIAGVLQNRRTKISNDLDKAATFRANAEKLEAAYKVSLERAYSDAAEVFTKANAEATEFATKKHAELDAKLHEKTMEAETKISAAREKAFGEISAVSSELALEIVQKLTDMKIDRKQADAAIKASVKQ